MNHKLQQIADCIPVMKQMTGVDAAITVWNKDAVAEAFFKSKSFDFEVPIGYQCEDKSDALYEVLRTGKQVYNRLPKETFGVALEGTLTPIFDGREVVGVVTYIFSSEAKDNILEYANNLTSSITKTDQSIEEISKGTEHLAANMSQVQKITELVKVQVEEANKVVADIQSNAKYSNILALNASIESARAGEAGKGFAVVSEEMRKFSKMSSDAAAKINTNLESIIESINEVKESIDDSTEVAEEQAQAASELSNMFETVSHTAFYVAEICKKTTNI